MNTIQIARTWRERNPLFLDTETTGLDGQIVEVAVVDLAGNVLLDTLVRPRWGVEDDARAVHGITDEMLASAPTFETVWAQLREILRGRLVLVYNAAFDIKCLRNSARDERDDVTPLWDEVFKFLRNGLTWKADTEIECVMELFAEFYGDWSDYHRSYRWQPLQSAAHYFGIGGQNHRALGDAQLARQVFLGMCDAQVDSAAETETT